MECIEHTILATERQAESWSGRAREERVGTFLRVRQEMTPSRRAAQNAPIPLARSVAAVPGLHRPAQVQERQTPDPRLGREDRQLRRRVSEPVSSRKRPYAALRDLVWAPGRRSRHGRRGRPSGGVFQAWRSLSIRWTPKTDRTPRAHCLRRVRRRIRDAHRRRPCHLPRQPHRIDRPLYAFPIPSSEGRSPDASTAVGHPHIPAVSQRGSSPFRVGRTHIAFGQDTRVRVLLCSTSPYSTSTYSNCKRLVLQSWISSLSFLATRRW